MQYHAKSLAQLHPFGFVTQIGYVGEEVMVRPNPQHKAVVMVEKRISPWEAPFLRRIALLHACTFNLFHSLLFFLVLMSYSLTSLFVSGQRCGSIGSTLCMLGFFATL